MQDNSKSNYDFKADDLFEGLNQYFILFFSLACILSSVFFQEIFIMVGQFRLGISIAPTLGIVLPTYLLARRFRYGVRRQLRIHTIRLKTTIHVFLGTLTMVVIIDHVYLFSQRFMPAPTEYLEGLKVLRPEGIGAIVITFIGLCVVVPIAEEIVFRGIVQRIFERNMRGIAAILLAGIFFGVIHLNPQLLLSMVCFGVFVGFVFYMTSNLSYAVLSHMVLNVVAFLQLTLGPDDFEVRPFYVREGWVFLVAVAMVAILLWEIKRGVAITTRTPSDVINGSNDDLNES